MPYLNVDNDNLVYIKYVSYKKDWPKLKRDINSKIGGQLKFIETFEAWFRRRIGHIVLEFDTRESLVEFVYLLNVGKFLDDQVFYQVLYEDSRKEFFDMIRKNTDTARLITASQSNISKTMSYRDWKID
ncbi:hypothetical protein DdX_15683 [Ditylenchus destructor]|uniref:Uncharacterized protein n=1 Tax=Ditylenchus destructor TaxID=166010 RepID=A0AAD4QUI0_9BILA|nr:hypothetical protein DdX_15683 [Ditylenchus destructor]